MGYRHALTVVVGLIASTSASSQITTAARNNATLLGTSAVSINNVDPTSNAAYYRNNADGSIPIQFDGPTPLLTASATYLGSTQTIR